MSLPYGQELRVAFRRIRKHLALSAVVVMTLGLGIGANSAIFSVANRVLLRPLPFRESHQLVELRQIDRRNASRNIGVSVAEYKDFRSGSAQVLDIAEYSSASLRFLGSSEPLEVRVGVVSANYFGVLGVRPALGQSFQEGDDVAGATAAVLLTRDFWLRELSGDSGVIGRLFRINSVPVRVIGILPAILEYPDRNDVYVTTIASPFRSSPRWIDNRSMRTLRVIGRLRSRTIEEASAVVDAVSLRLRQDHPGDDPIGAAMAVELVPLRDAVIGRAPGIVALLGSVAFLLLVIACANVAGLNLAQLIRREPELATLVALGAPRARILTQLFVEAAVLAGLGILAGLSLAAATMHVLRSYLAGFTPRASEITMDVRTVAFAAVIGAIAALAFGVLPALPLLRSRRRVVVSVGRVTQSRRQRTLHAGLIVAQVALSFVLLAGAGLALRTLHQLHKARTGIETTQVSTMRINMNRFTNPGGGWPFYEELLSGVRALPEVQSASVAMTYPLDGTPVMASELVVEGEAAEQQLRMAEIRVVSSDYFRTLHIPVLAGREFQADDRSSAEPVIIVNRSLARQLFGDRAAIGRRIAERPDGDAPRWRAIVGVVGDVRQHGLASTPQPEYYIPASQTTIGPAHLLIRTSAAPHGLAKGVSSIARRINPEQPISAPARLEDSRQRFLASPTMISVLLATFGALGLLVTAVGIGGMLASSVTMRHREIGVRMALGANRGAVIWSAARDGLTAVGVGLCIGTGIAAIATMAMSSMLHGVGATDPLTFAATCAVLAIVAVLAAVVPARSAARVDPVVALRADS